MAYDLGGGKGLTYAEGMTSTSNVRIIYLDDILGDDGVEAIEHKDGMSFLPENLERSDEPLLKVGHP